MRRSRWRLAALISGSTAAALRAPVSHAQAALARCRRSPAAGISFLLNHHIPPTPIRASAFIGRHQTIRKNKPKAVPLWRLGLLRMLRDDDGGDRREVVRYL